MMDKNTPQKNAKDQKHINIQLGDSLRHTKAGTIVVVLDVEENQYYDTTKLFYKVRILQSTDGSTGGLMQLPYDNIDDWEKVEMVLKKED